MSYLNAKEILPKDVLELLQQYAEGTCLYIPQREVSKQPWGSRTTTKSDLSKRNAAIYDSYLKGESCHSLASRYYLSEKSIQRIVRTQQPIKPHEPESL